MILLSVPWPFETPVLALDTGAALPGNVHAIIKAFVFLADNYRASDWPQHFFYINQILT